MSLAARMLLAAACVGTLHAHVVSMSSGELTVNGTDATYELRMPMYELAHVTNPDTALFEHVSFAGARRTSGSCKEDDGTYVCTATYEFARPVPDKLDARCTLFQVTVPNHVHLLHASQGPNGDQVVFDQRFTEAEVRFHPPSPIEILMREIFAGMGRLFTSVSGLLFVAALALAARSKSEAALFPLLFLAGEWLARPLAPRVPLALSTQFLEAAMALTASYLAVEVLLLPAARGRWMALPILGLVHGLFFAAFPANYLTGASIAQVCLVALLAAGALRLPDLARRIAVAAVLAASLGWFVRRLVS